MPFGHFVLALRNQLESEHINGNTGIYASISPDMQCHQVSKEGKHDHGSENYQVVKNVGKPYKQ